MKRLQDIYYDFPEEAIKKRLNRKGGRFTENFERIWIDMKVLSYELIYPRGIYDRVGVKVDNFVVSLSGVGVIESKLLSKLLRGSKYAYVFACTIGDKLERKVEEFTNSGRLAEAVLLDAIGSEVVDKVADVINDMIKIEAKSMRMQTTRRFSPGYGDVPISFNKNILKYLDTENFLGISFSEGGLMFPQKSITAILGVF